MKLLSFNNHDDKEPAFGTVTSTRALLSRESGSTGNGQYSQVQLEGSSYKDGPTTHSLECTSTKRKVPWTDIVPWPDSVQLPSLLAEIESFFATYVRAPADYLMLAALWVVGSHLMRLWTWFPRLYCRSALENSGKTTFGSCIVYCCPRGFELINTTPATLFRAIDQDAPTLFLDEADNYLESNDQIIAILNNGQRRDGVLPRCERVVGADGQSRIEVRYFSVYAAVVMAGLGDLRRTLRSRSLALQLVPATKSDQPQKWTELAKVEALELCRKAARWAMDNENAVAEPYKTLPTFGVNRQDDNARPLLAIASLAGSDRLERARQALHRLWEEDATPPGLAHRLFVDILAVFLASSEGTNAPAAMQASGLAKKLVALEDAEWSRARRGKPIDAAWLRDELRSAFQLRTKNVKIDGAVRKGFHWSDLDQIAQIHRDGLCDTAVTMSASEEVIRFLSSLENKPVEDQKS